MTPTVIYQIDRVIIPRECPSPKTVHCIGSLPAQPQGIYRLKCDFCGRWLSLSEAIDFTEEAIDD